MATRFSTPLDPATEYVDDVIHEVEALPEFVSPALEAMLAAWLGARAGRPLPRRSELDPTLFPKLLPYCWIYRHLPEAEDDFLCELAGEELRFRYNELPVRKRLSEMLSPNVVPVVKRHFKLVLDGALGYSRGDVYLWSLRAPGKGERLILPLADASDKPAFVFGATVHGQPEPERIRTSKARIWRCVCPLSSVDG